MGGKKIKALLFEPDKAPRQIEIEGYDDIGKYIGCKRPFSERLNSETRLFFSDIAFGEEYKKLPYTTRFICGEYSGDCTEDRFTGVKLALSSLDEHTLNWYMSGEYL